MPACPKILILDLIGLAFGAGGKPDASEVKAHIEARGGIFIQGSQRDFPPKQTASKPHFYYLPVLSSEADILAETSEGQYDALIAAATFIPKAARFDLGGVRIGAGTGNMGSESWGGGDGRGGIAPLMNTPGINARATAQMAMKALLRVSPDLPVEKLNDLVAAGAFDTGRDLAKYPTAKLEGRSIGIIGYGNIGRELAKLARAFGMIVRIHARERHQKWIESEGFLYAKTPLEAAKGAHVLSVHIGLGPLGEKGYANAGLINEGLLNALEQGAVLLNYDRGELVDVAALDAALTLGRVAHAAIDADLFRDVQTGAFSGPMLPYLSLLKAHRDRLSLLPHAAADTDHPTRVAGAKQAVDQILDAIQKREIRNLKGDLPEGYRDCGALRPLGLGTVTAGDLQGCLDLEGEALLTEAKALTHAIEAAMAGDLAAQGEALLLSANRLRAALQRLGLEGAFSES